MFGDIVQVDLPVWLARKYYGKEMRRRERRAFCSTTGKKKKKCGPSLRLVPAVLVPEVSVFLPKAASIMANCGLLLGYRSHEYLSTTCELNNAIIRELPEFYQITQEERW